ncbi:sn-glycerol-3-phosphate ABC transporter ATP-binding protein UgpC [Rubellimicrobium rubrum]|uniref:sn-glycerol-3-phosphate ABC transporter ATP-binding protein UgpC n=1 Tax=Rubellimicrobium rubrum TaxID=2585369 RepID=A0A5C4MVN4_9RHOB|nr:sn-glycerol-3-phosphate ABC transporter ATP-binding protein UgpC [Rubellimicrobium rubrum]TNC48569.1 sn-glycerol-3-phosphate ABC transporter ATP-binding protein UgpC [Rubellimicrobium rubrum]
MSQIALKGVTKSFGGVSVIHGVDLDIETGELVVFVGPSGCGKSTLLRLISGLDQPSAGAIEIDGRDVTRVSAADRGLAMVFQSYALYPHMTVRQNLSFGLENTRMAKAEVTGRVAEAARMLNIEPLLDRRPTQLSGGQRQRVAIGRAIVRNPTAFLLDEPLSNLDAELRVSMRAELAALHARLGTTMIYVTHDQIEAMTLASRIVVLRAGRVEQVARPLDLFNRPANLFVAGFIGAPSMNLFPTRAEGGTAALPGGRRVPMAGVPEGSEVTIGLRPQHLRLAQGNEPGFDLRIALIEALGTETVVHGELAGTSGDTPRRVFAILPGQPGVALGDILRLGFDEAYLHRFGPDGQRLVGPGRP